MVVYTVLIWRTQLRSIAPTTHLQRCTCILDKELIEMKVVTSTSQRTNYIRA